MRKLVLALLLVGGLSFAKDRVFFSMGISLGTPYYCPKRVVYVERPVVYRPYYPPVYYVPVEKPVVYRSYYTPVYYVPVEKRIVIIHKHKHEHRKHWKEWE